MRSWVSARAYRPQTFSEVKGQDTIVQTLRNALRQHKIAQAYLFFGPRGVGKTTCARILAKAVNCENLTSEGDPCNQCPSCIQFNRQSAPNLLELDAASHNSVDDIRAIIERIHLAPPAGKYNVYIIDEVHMLSQAAFNAFLKTLEEPPAHALFILATTEKHKVPATILSRCQRFDFRRLSVEEIVSQLKQIAQKEQISYEEDAIFLIATKAEGGMRDALSLFDQLVGRSEGNLTYSLAAQTLEVLEHDVYLLLIQALYHQEMDQGLDILHTYLARGYEPKSLLQGLLQSLRLLLIWRYTPQAKKEIAPGFVARYEEAYQMYSPSYLIHAIQVLLEAERQMLFTSQPALALEAAILKLGLLPAYLASMPQAQISAQPVQPPPAVSAPARKTPSASLKIPKIPPAQSTSSASLDRQKVIQAVQSIHVAPTLRELIRQNHFDIDQDTIKIWVPDKAHVVNWQSMAQQLEGQLTQALSHARLRVVLQEDPDRFKHLSSQVWESLVQENPMLRMLQDRLGAELFNEENP
ncbi:MAG: DNA polymerase III subunit gamma/tau [Bacteroidia bacterium]